VGEVHGGVAPHQRAFEHTNKFYGLASFIVFAYNLWLWQRNIPQYYTCYPCSDDSLRTDASLGSKQHSTPKESDQRRDDQLTTTPENRPDQYQDCVGPWPGYPECAEKMEWMARNWQIDECYSRSGVDGSRCSFQRYLSEIEHWCPLLRNKTKLQRLQKTATICYNPDPLLQKLSHNSKFDWLRRRISTLWPQWVKAGRTLEAQKPFKHTEKSVRQLVHAWLLQFDNNFKCIIWGFQIR